MNKKIRWGAGMLAILFCILGFGAEAERSLTPFFQLDYTEEIYPGHPVNESGCWAACASMIISYYGDENEPVPEPPEVFQWAVDEGLYTGAGITMGKLEKILEHYGIKSERKKLTGKQIKDRLNNVGPFVMYTEEGYFSKGGHYIVLLSIDENLMVTVVDPNSRKKSEEKHYLGDLMENEWFEESYIVPSGTMYEVKK